MDASTRRASVKGAADNPILLDENGRVVDSFSKSSSRGDCGNPILLDESRRVVESFGSNGHFTSHYHHEHNGNNNGNGNHGVSRHLYRTLYGAGRRLVIFGGPPSLIGRSTRATASISSAPRAAAAAASTSRASASTAPGAALAARARTLALRLQVNTLASAAPANDDNALRIPRPPLIRIGPPSLSQTRFRRWPREVLIRGWRAPREEPLDENSLYVGPLRPPEFAGGDNHLCGICLNILSHPVLSPCQHHHYCYVCIRQWLECSWRCPNCRHRMMSPPKPDNAREQAICAEHPTWSDPSTVTFSWRGLKFPQNPNWSVPETP
ncbi:hypothetical protein C8F04DRAFT_1252414 [Mycena alexandri]|uniref:RING-type domain-containing protein n=1 Tax=Mycena alexandri TaxID=1745969 RepID=A0AAD6X9T2_9AGAR|nr:hypothetical protein C8F04DRAFT_1252414 [Mycena alexandri]